MFCHRTIMNILTHQYLRLIGRFWNNFAGRNVILNFNSIEYIFTGCINGFWNTRGWDATLIFGFAKFAIYFRRNNLFGGFAMVLRDEICWRIQSIDLRTILFCDYLRRFLGVYDRHLRLSRVTSLPQIVIYDQVFGKIIFRSSINNSIIVYPFRAALDLEQPRKL